MSDGHNPRPSLYPPVYHGEGLPPPRMPDPYDPYPVYPPPVPDDSFAHNFTYPPYEGRPPNLEFPPKFVEAGNAVPYPPPPVEHPYPFHPPGHSESFSAREDWTRAPDFLHSYSERVDSPHGRSPYEESQRYEHLSSHGRDQESPRHGHSYRSHEESHGYEHLHTPGHKHISPHRGDHHHESPHRPQHHEESHEFKHHHRTSHEGTQGWEQVQFYGGSHESPHRSHHYPSHEQGYEQRDSHVRSHESRYESPQHSQHYPPHLQPTNSYGSHHGEESFGRDRSKSSHGRATGPVVKICCKAKPEFNLALRHDGVVLVPADTHDESQQWIWDQSWSTRVKDVTGQPAFALVNKASNEALKHAKEAFQQVLTAYYPPETIDESILWTQSEDMGEGYRTIRKANDITLNLDALKGDKKSGGVREGTPAILFKWKKQENQLWKIIPL